MKYIKQYNTIDDYKNDTIPLFHPYLCLIKGSEIPNFDTFEMIDLGLPSGIKWANMNVGATDITDIGLWFQWGSTKGIRKKDVKYESLSWTTCPFNGGNAKFNESSVAAISGSAFPKKYLIEKYDVASVYSDNEYCMPTNDNIKELFDNTTSSTTVVNGVSGVTYTSNINGNAIFFPYTGYFYTSSWLYPKTISFWSSTFNYTTTASFAVGGVRINDDGTLRYGEQANMVKTVRYIQKSKTEENNNE